MIDLSHLHRITVAEYRAGSSHRWKSCLAASCIVGRYEKGATLSLAHDLCISVSQVENLARAGLTWRALCRYGITSETRNRLTPSHFCAMGELLRRYEFSPYEAVDYLRAFAAEGASVETMRTLIDGKYGGEIPEWLRRLKGIMTGVSKLVNDYGVPEGVRSAAKQFIESIIEAGNEQPEQQHNPTTADLSAGGGDTHQLE